MAVEHESEMVLLLNGVIDVLGVVVGPSRLHIPAESGHRKALPKDCGQPVSALCGTTVGCASARYEVADAPMCRNCTRIAANLVRAGDR